MKKTYYDAETDSLYIYLSDSPSVDSEIVNDDIVLDLDADGRLVGIDIQHASKQVTSNWLMTEAA